MFEKKRLLTLGPRARQMLTDSPNPVVIFNPDNTNLWDSCVILTRQLSESAVNLRRYVPLNVSTSPPPCEHRCFERNILPTLLFHSYAQLVVHSCTTIDCVVINLFFCFYTVRLGIAYND